MRMASTLTLRIAQPILPARAGSPHRTGGVGLVSDSGRRPICHSPMLATRCPVEGFRVH